MEIKNMPIAAPAEVEELVFEELEQRLVPDFACVTSSSCNCSSSSCTVWGS